MREVKISVEKSKRKKLPFKYIWMTLMESVIIAGLFFIFGSFIAGAFSPASKNASALVYFTNTEEAEMLSDNGIDYTARKVALLRQACLSSEALETAVKDTSLSVTALADILSVERLGNSSGAAITLSGLKARSDAPLILGKMMNYLLKNFEGGEFHVISYCDLETEPALPLTAFCVSFGIIAGSVYFKGMYTVRKKRHSQKRRAKMPHNSERNGQRGHQSQTRDPKNSAPVPGKRYIETAMLKAQSLGKTDSAAPLGLEKSGYAHAAKVLAENAFTSDNIDGSAVIAVCAAHKPENPQREVPIDGTFAAYLSCALAEIGCRTALIECDLKNPVIGKIFRKTGKGGLADMAAGNCTIWDILLPNARKGVDIICDKRAYPAPPAVFSASCFGELISYLSPQYDVILLHTPKGWSCPEWDLIYRFCTGIVAVAEEGKKPDKTCAMGILDSKSRFTGLAEMHDLPASPEQDNIQKEKAGKEPVPKKTAPKKSFALGFGKISPAADDIAPEGNVPRAAVPRTAEPKRDVVLVKVPEPAKNR